MIALVATIVCLPLLALEFLGGASGAADDAAVLRTDGVQSSLVAVTLAPTTAAPTTAEPAPPAPEVTEAPVVEPPVTAAAPTTVARRVVTTTSTVATPPPPPPVPPVAAGSDWDRLAQCESSGNWAMNSGNGYSGGLQFHPDTWRRNGGAEFAPEAWMASREAQIAVGERLRARSGWSSWPGCSRKLGLR